MSAAFLAALLCSVAAYIHTRSADPRMRPASPLSDLAWRVLSYASLIAWGALVMRAFAFSHWSDGVAMLLGSFAANWYFNHRGPRPAWPGLSMLFAVVGLALAAWSFANE
ncbi:multidrug DMT transporter permease [Roseomonas sp. AR75]|jgi:hypothetical protein|uniref:multidrug DMT transporter permease n=1 Tax=Roseomonas sp. AR75 TaxID=2562311 RepID=UPI0010C13DFE|nr:multidrug DMT transporter permease [Roseomonas sp. AR75]